MMSMDAIHVYVEKGGEHDKVGGNTPPKIDDYLGTVHESQCRAKTPLYIDDKKDKECGVMEERITQ